MSDKPDLLINGGRDMAALQYRAGRGMAALSEHGLP